MYILVLKITKNLTQIYIKYILLNPIHLINLQNYITEHFYSKNFAYSKNFNLKN